MLNLLAIGWESLRPESVFGGQVLERTPAALSLIYLFGLLVIVAFLFAALLRRRSKPYRFESALDPEVRRRSSRTLTNRSVLIWQIVFVILAFGSLAFHVYWVYYAEETNEDFQALTSRDRRQQRASATALRGWILDRSGELSNALAYYKVDEGGGISREYSLVSEMSHLLGTEQGAPGLERTLFQRRSDQFPESWRVLTTIRRVDGERSDVRLTIDRRLQEFAASQLEGKKGAVVVINPQTGELLAMHSSPSFKVGVPRTLEEWMKLESDKRDNPLLNRATREYYVPGSTFKLFTMIAAFRAGKQGATYESRQEGFVPFKGSRAIADAVPPCEPPYGCRTLNMAQAFEASSNQYFAQLAVELGRDRLKETAKALGIAAYDDPAQTRSISFLSEIWNASDQRIKKALAIEQSAIVTGKGISAYDLALQGMGQGYSGQMTPFQMALIAAAAGNLEGRLMKPKIEYDLKPEIYSEVLSPRQAADVRRIMALVTEGSGGTATSVFGAVRAAGIRSGGKTGTAEKTAPVFDPVTGKAKKEIRRRMNAAGEWEEYETAVSYERVDSWYIAVAPLEKPTLAISVVVEGGGYGSKVAAPIAANIILKARDLGLIAGTASGPKVQPKRGVR